MGLLCDLLPILLSPIMNHCIARMNNYICGHSNLLFPLLIQLRHAITLHNTEWITRPRVEELSYPRDIKFLLYPVSYYMSRAWHTDGVDIVEFLFLCKFQSFINRIITPTEPLLVRSVTYVWEWCMKHKPASIVHPLVESSSNGFAVLSFNNMVPAITT